MDAARVDALTLTCFKSYMSQSFRFGEGFQVLAGPNGAGKTNVLDALFYLGMCKSYFSLKDRELVRHGEDFFRLEASCLSDGRPAKLVAKIRPGDTKVFEREGKPYDTLSAHIGWLPVVLIAPNDTQLVSGFSEERRRFLDQTLCQVDAIYLTKLSEYNRLLLQRNAWLKQNMYAAADPGVLAAIDSRLAEPAAYITQARAEGVTRIAFSAKEVYGSLSREKEEPAVIYQSASHGLAWKELAARSRSADLRLGRTTDGPHRDDLDLRLNGFPARRFSSQGQLKSLILALKLAQYDLISERKGIRPLLLMDDIFDKLDQDRVNELIRYLCSAQVGQVFVTDTDAERVPEVLRSLGQPCTIFEIRDSQVRS